MTIVTLQMILELNTLIKDRGLSFTIHLCDSCGGQSLRIQSSMENNFPDIPENLYEIIESYFQKYRMKIHYFEGKTAFQVIS